MSDCFFYKYRIVFTWKKRAAFRDRKIQLACHAPHVTLRIQRFHGRDQFGILIRLEALVVRDLRIYAESLDGDVYHYRDNLDNECDIVIHLRDGRYALLEVKREFNNGVNF